MDTKTIIEQAAFDLFETKAFRSITVQDILDRAKVSRKTFYAYYRDKYELMHSYFHSRIGEHLITGFDGSNWFELQRDCFDYFLSHAPYLKNVKNTHGQDSFWPFLQQYAEQFFRSVKERNKGRTLSEEEEAVVTAIGAASVHLYSRCISTPERCDSGTLTRVLEQLIPPSYRTYTEKR